GYFDLKPTDVSPATSGLFGRTRGVVCLYMHTKPDGSLPTLTVDNEAAYSSKTATWQLYEAADGTPAAEELASGTIAPLTEVDLEFPGPYPEGAYFFIYND